jgi:hypothetical protein
MNREENLINAMKTWIGIQEISEIIVVDWNSEKKLRYEDLPNKNDNEFVKLLRVNDEKSWILSHAFNLAFSFAKYDKLLKIDADIELNHDFIKKHKLEEGNFFRGNHLIARNKNEIHLNGQLLCYSDNFKNINGYNENITTYGYDDTDLYERLENLEKLKPLDFDYDTLNHVHTDDELRGKYQKITTTKPWAFIDLFENKQVDNRILNELIWIPFPQTNENLRLFFETQLNRIKCRQHPWDGSCNQQMWNSKQVNKCEWECTRIYEK